MEGKLERLIQGWSGQGVLARFDPPTESWIFLCLHDDTLGPFLGGTRMRVYPEPAAALKDGMRLATGMTSKWAVIGFEAGGGKAVLSLSRPLGEGERQGLLERYGRLVESLRGAFQTGEDLGTTPADMEVIHRYTRFVHGFDPETGEKIDPGPYTARGVYAGLKAGLQEVFGSPEPKARRVLVEGIGSVGWPLARDLAAAGATLLVADIDGGRLARATEELGAEVVSLELVPSTPCDVYAPCALGGSLNRETIPHLQCRLVAGSANNQLGEPSDAGALAKRGILYLPDYVVNAGGALAFSLLHRGARRDEALLARVDGLGETVTSILAAASEHSETPLEAAQRRVQEALARARDASRGHSIT